MGPFACKKWQSESILIGASLHATLTTLSQVGFIVMVSFSGPHLSIKHRNKQISECRNHLMTWFTCDSRTKLLLQMHCYECIQLPWEPNVLHANARFYPSKERINQEQKLLPRTHHNERIQLPQESNALHQILVLQVHTNKAAPVDKKADDV